MRGLPAPHPFILPAPPQEWIRLRCLTLLHRPQERIALRGPRRLRRPSLLHRPYKGIVRRSRTRRAVYLCTTLTFVLR